jgi:hypothetical protein
MVGLSNNAFTLFRVLAFISMAPAVITAWLNAGGKMTQ